MTRRILIGLGNPGEKYYSNRHNAGKLFIDYLRNKLKGFRLLRLKEKNQTIALVFEANNLVFAKTETFMNLSGKTVKKIIDKWKLKIEDLFIVHDDLDIPLGKFKIQFGQGPKLHNGIKSIEEMIKTKNFWRIRIGVDTRTKDNWIEGESYVLEDFSQQEKEILEKKVFPKILERIKNF